MYMTAVIKTAAKANKVSKVPIVCSTSSPRRAPTYWDIKTVPPEAKPIIKNVNADTISPPMPTAELPAAPLTHWTISISAVMYRF